ncbi:hypothetical protein [Streptomyces sp. DHE17-7]|uniref:hypothetical protein n=1 Tax=Streptomyces sp. DHE17-7 TaxID=2759949 RepID=UPI0022EA7C75|nr:hypothetical protein [Streptomyces sp. DHE17-7]MBJ6623598.1 hypothetical protein [Streptomyces sp. DHE17-7]
MIKTTTTRNGQFRATVQGHAGVRYETPAYLTERMAAADAECWAAFHTDESAQERYMRMRADENAPAENVPVQAVRAGDYVLHTTHTSAWVSRLGTVHPSRTETAWIQVVRSAWQSLNPTANFPAQYKFRLKGITYAEAHRIDTPVRVLKYPEALESAQREAKKELRERADNCR